MIILGLQSKENTLKRGAGIVSAAAVDLTLEQKSAVTAHWGWNFKKKISSAFSWEHAW